MSYSKPFDCGIRTKNGALTLDGEFRFLSKNWALSADKGLTLKSGNVIADCYTSTGNAVRTDYGETITLTDDVTYFLASSYDKGYSTIKYGKLVFSDKFELTLPVNGVIKDGVVYEADGLYEASLDVCLKRKIEMTEHENKDSGIIVTLEDGVELVVDDVTGEEEYGNIVITEGEKVCAVYNVTLIKNGEEVQPAAEITVKIPWNGDPEAKVYRQEDKYTVRDMHATYEDGYLVFQTTHFSIYMISAPAPEYSPHACEKVRR